MRLSTLLLAFSLLTTAACKKGGGSPKSAVGELSEDEKNQPGPNFKNGLAVVKAPDKNGYVDYGRAYTYFDQAALLGGGAKAHFNAGWTADRAGRPQDAVVHYKAALEADPTMEPAMFSLASAYIESGDPENAVALYKNYLAQNPKSDEVRNELVAALVQAKKHDEAAAEAQEILRHDPKNAQVFRSLSAMYYDKQQLGMSQLTAEQALKNKDGDPGTYNNMGVSFLTQGKAPEAIEKFKQAVALESTHYEANYNLGWIALNSGDYQLAADSFTNALKSKPGETGAKLGLAISSRGLADYKTAERLYDEIMAAEKDNESAYFNAATLQEIYTKNFKKALQILQAYADAHPVGPDHEVFARMKRVEAAKAEEDERKRVEAEKKKAEEERRKRNAELLKNMSTLITSMQEKLSMNQACVDPMVTEEVGMVLEQAQMVVDAQDVDMAPDMQTMLEGYQPVIDEAVGACAGAAPAPEEGAGTEGAGEEGAAPDEAPPEDGEAPAPE